MKKILTLALSMTFSMAFSQTCPTYPGQTMISANTYTMTYSQSVGATQNPTPPAGGFTGNLASNWSTYDANTGTLLTTTVSCGGLYGNNTSYQSIIPSQSLPKIYPDAYQVIYMTSTMVACTWYVVINPVTGGCGSITTGISESNAISANQIYPNPSNGEITIKTHGESTITITDNLGKIVQTKSFSDETEIVGLSAGIYFATIKEGNNFSTQKLIVTQ